MIFHCVCFLKRNGRPLSLLSLYFHQRVRAVRRLTVHFYGPYCRPKFLVAVQCAPPQRKTSTAAQIYDAHFHIRLQVYSLASFCGLR